MLTATDINAAIAARDTEVERLRRELVIAEAKLRGMHELRDQILGPSATIALKTQSLATASNTAKPRFRGGRQPGAISKPWRAILKELYRHSGSGGGFSDEEVISAAKEQSIDLKPSDARSRMAAYKEHRYIEDGPFDETWKVTDFAARKFGFPLEADKKEAPNADNALEPLDEEDQTGAG